MPSTITNCPHCGARPKSPGKTCEFCGALLPVAATTTDSSTVEDPAGRFARLENHPSYPDLLNKRPTPARRQPNHLGIIFILAFIVATATLIAKSNPADYRILIPIGIILLALILLIRHIRRSKQQATLELTALPAIVSSERTQVTPTSDDTHHTRYFITLESRDGKRTELATSSALTRKLTPGDIGIAYLKGDHLIDFEHVRI